MAETDLVEMENEKAFEKVKKFLVLAMDGRVQLCSVYENLI